MASTHVEREDKYDVAATFRLPTGLGLEDAGTVHLEATYYDTAEHDLLRQRMTLRHRTGGADAGWHLKVPHGSARLEIRLPDEAGPGVPDQLRELVTGAALGAELVPAAVLRTERRVGLLRDGERVLAEIADDTVHAAATGDVARVSQWREVEVELVDGDERVLRRVGKALRAAGAVPSASRSKVGRAVGDVTRTAGPSGAARLVGDYLADQYATLVAGDVAMRRGRHEVHKTRVAARRIRSVLRVFAPVLDADRIAAVQDELSWYQDLLGEVRDAQVQRARLLGAVAELPPELVLGPVVADIEAALTGAESRAFEQARAALDGERYRELLQAVRALVDDPPVAPGVSTKRLAQLESRARRRSARRLRAGLHGTDAMVHRARKAAKRSRYAAELLAGRGTGGASKDARRSIKSHRRLQDALGDYQDSVVAAGHLRTLGAASAASGRNGFTFGLLWAREEQRRAALRRDVAAMKL